MKNSSTTDTGRFDTVGIDLGDAKSSYCVVSRDGEVLVEAEVRTTSSGFQRCFEGIQKLRIIMEAGTHSPWVSRLLTQLGHEVVVVNPRQLELISHSNQKTDRHDASTLALVGRLDTNLQLLRSVTHRPAQMQEDLTIIHLRDGLVRARTLLIVQLRGVVKSNGGRLPRCSAPAFHKKVLAFIPPALLPGATHTLALIEQHTREIAKMDELIAELCRTRYPETQLLTPIKGVANLTALSFILTLADPTRFSVSRKVGSYLGLVPRQRQSGQRDPRLSITKAGDSYLRQILTNASHYIIGPFGPDCDLRRFGLKLAARADKRKAVIAVARKLATLLHFLWLNGAVYEPFHNASPEAAA